MWPEESLKTSRKGLGMVLALKNGQNLERTCGNISNKSNIHQQSQRIGNKYSTARFQCGH